VISLTTASPTSADNIHPGPVRQTVGFAFPRYGGNSSATLTDIFVPAFSKRAREFLELVLLGTKNHRVNPSYLVQMLFPRNGKFASSLLRCKLVSLNKAMAFIDPSHLQFSFAYHISSRVLIFRRTRIFPSLAYLFHSAA
jgi:hypothetical protein